MMSLTYRNRFVGETNSVFGKTGDDASVNASHKIKGSLLRFKQNVCGRTGGHRELIKQKILAIIL